MQTSTTLTAFLGHTANAVALAGQAAQWLPLLANADPVIALFEHALQMQPRPSTVDLWLSGAWARPFMVGPLAGVRNWREVEAVLAAMAPEATGLAGPCAVWVERPVHRETALVVAVSRTVLEDLHRHAGAHRFRLRSVRPWWSAAFNASRAATPEANLRVLDDGEALTILQEQEGVCSYARTQWPAPDVGQRTGWLARLMAGRNLACSHLNVARIGAVSGPLDLPLPGVPFGASLQRAQDAEEAVTS